MPYIGKEPVAGNFVLLDSITTSATATYALTKDSVAYSPESARNMIVSLNGVTQAPESAFTVSGSNITFSSALTASDVIDYILVLGDVLSVGTPSDGTVGTSQMSYPLGNFSSTGIDDNATSTAITIDSSENVGIGTTTPVSLGAGYKNLDIRHTTGGGVTLGDASNIHAYLFSDNNGVTLQSPGSRSIKFTTVSTERMRIDSSGNVGIGATSLSNKLTVNGDQALLANGELKFADATNNQVGTIRNSGGASTSQLEFLTSSTERMRINSSGNVGIGETNPDGLLHLTGDTNANGAELFLQVNNNNTTDNLGAIHFGNNTDSTLSRILSGTSGTSTTSYLTFATSSSGTITERMRIDSSGNVGIGTASPFADSGYQSLDIRGSSTGGQIHFGTTSTRVGQISASVGGGMVLNTVGSKDLRLFTNGGERVTIKPSGNVGIGTTNPAKELAVALISTTGTTLGQKGGIELYSPSGTAGNGGEITWSSGSGNTETWCAISGHITSNSATGSVGDLVFATKGAQADTAPTERMRIDSSGRLLIGKSATSNATDGYFLEPGSGGYASFVNSATASSNRNILCNRHGGDGDTIQFRRANVQVGSISVTSSTTTYNTSSDARLKENIVDASSASDDIDAIQVRSFDWKADGSHQKYGMVAQELVTVAPEAVTQPEDPEEMMGVDYSKLVPMMIKEIQDLRARVAQLEGA